jgi:aminoglycoside phosphotransferase (APT) family kinase protein
MTGNDRPAIEPTLVGRMIATQFPQWAGLPVRPVDVDGWDNHTFRLGTAMKVRLPSAAAYVAQVTKEDRWLPHLAPLLPLPIPVPLALGAAAEDYPWPWSVQSWLEGETASRERILDLGRFAISLAEFLVALQRIPAVGPPAGPHSFFRGGPLGVYDTETRQCLDALRGTIDVAEAGAVWSAALAAPWRSPAVWVHGDVATGNLLVREGRLGAVIDFGACAVGDPACDLVIAWTFLAGESREAFRRTLTADDATWARARGWALWKALLVLAANAGKGPDQELARRVIAEISTEHRGRPR